PRCAPPGATATIHGRGFGATNVRIVVGGVPAQILHATGNEIVFVIPAALSPGVVSVVKAVNPGAQTGSIALRIQGPEICGNGTDDDCDGIVDNPELCAPVNYPPVANAGPDVTAPVGTTGPLDGQGSTDVDGDPLTYRWSFTSRPAGSSAVLSGAGTATPTFTIDRAGDYVVQLHVNDGLLDSAPDTVTISTLNSLPVADAGP